MNFLVNSIEFDFDDDYPEEQGYCNSDLETFFIASEILLDVSGEQLLTIKNTNNIKKVFM